MPIQQLSCDILIVGAGPAGLSVAAALPDDVSVIIVHQDKDIGKPVRTSGGSWVSDLERLGVPRHLYQALDTLDFYSDQEKARFSMQEDTFAVLDITKTYQWLASKSDHKKRKLFLSSKFISAQQTGENYISHIRRRGADDLEITAQYLIDASGHHCAVLEALSLAKKPARLGIGIEYEYPIAENDPKRAILFVGRDALSGYGWVFPTPDQKIRIGIGVMHPDTDVSPKDLYAEFIASNRLESFGVQIDGAPLLHNAGIIPAVEYDPRLVFGNVIRVGDSANFATPTVGEGIRICIELGTLLGQKLGEALAHDTQTPLLQYEKTCRTTLMKDYWFGFRANKKISGYTPADWDKSIKRISHLSDTQMIALLRSEFTPRLIVSSFWKWIRLKINHLWEKS